MARLTRQKQKVFAGNANADQIAVLGTMKTGTPVYSTDLDSLQSAAYESGWSAAILDDKAPYLEETNGLQYGFSYQIAYLLQQGISIEWDSATTYYQGSIVAIVDTSDDVKVDFYLSLTDNNTGNNPTSDTVNWQIFYLENAGRIGEIHITTDFNNLPVNCVWLEGQTYDPTLYPKLDAIYGSTYNDGNEPTGYNRLPNFQDCVMWGGTTAGYISAGLPDITGRMGNTDNHSSSSTGCFYRSGTSGKLENETGNKDPNVYFAASRSNSIYGNSETVQPPAIKVRVYTRYQ